MSASEDAGMVRLRSLAPGDEFTFAPRHGRFRVLPSSNGGTRYVGIDLEGQETTPEPLVAMGNWLVWCLGHEKTDDEHR